MLKKLFFTTATLLLTTSAFSQFTYIQGNIGAKMLPLRYEYFGLYNTVERSVGVGVGATYRPIRNLGFSINFSTPLLKSSTSSFERWNSIGFINMKEGGSEHYDPNEFSYILESSSSITVSAKIFLEMDLNSFVDIRFSRMGYSEEFNFEREYVPENSIYAELPEVDVNDGFDHILFYPGIGVGVMPHMSNNIYVHASFIVDFVFFGESEFSHFIAYDWDYDNDAHQYGEFKSQAEGMKAMISLNVGAGYYF